MADDAIHRAETAMVRLHERALALSHLHEGQDISQIMQALALILEMQCGLSREHSRISQKLEH